MDQDNRRSVRKQKIRNLWKKAEPAFIDLWSKYSNDLRHELRKDPVYMKMVAEMSEKGFKIEPIQVKHKIRNLIKKFRYEAEQTEKTGRWSQWIHYDRIEEIILRQESMSTATYSKMNDLSKILEKEASWNPVAVKNLEFLYDDENVEYAKKLLNEDASIHSSNMRDPSIDMEEQNENDQKPSDFILHHSLAQKSTKQNGKKPLNIDSDDSSDLDELLNSDEDSTCHLSSINSISDLKKPQVVQQERTTWTQKDINKLISCVEKTPVIWDKTKNGGRIVRKDAWIKIAREDFSNKFLAEELMAKWNGMGYVIIKEFEKRYKKNEVSKREVLQTFITQAEMRKARINNLENNEEILPDCSTDEQDPRPSTPRQLSRSSSTSSMANMLGEALKEAVEHLQEHQQKLEDEFDAFGKYVASELRSLSDPDASQRVRFKVARFLIDCIEKEKQSPIHVEEEEHNYYQQSPMD